MYSYSQVEAALARVHAIEPTALGSFRGRIKHFQKLGIVPASPGRGKKIEYTLHHVMIWAFCFQFAEFGLDPSVIFLIWQMSWRQVGPVLCASDPELTDRYWHFSPSLLGRSGAGGNDELSQTSRASWLSGEIISELPGSSDTGYAVRSGQINLSRLRRSVLAALEAEKR